MSKYPTTQEEDRAFRTASSDTESAVSGDEDRTEATTTTTVHSSTFIAGMRAAMILDPGLEARMLANPDQFTEEEFDAVVVDVPMELVVYTPAFPMLAPVPAQRSILLERRRYTEDELYDILSSDHWLTEEPLVDTVELEGHFMLSDLEFFLSSTNWRDPPGTGAEDETDEGPNPKAGQKMRKRRRVQFEEDGVLICKDIGKDRAGGGAGEGGASGGSELV
ncbi:hypothetical protein B484DRAFT_471285 [Ochromonadaceae sp. CCMP2298]|nr:hypothetical protein B484DRAFT_471285 [Ochromonadaceae sp. CCMP2298]